LIDELELTLSGLVASLYEIALEAVDLCPFALHQDLLRALQLDLQYLFLQDGPLHHLVSDVQDHLPRSVFFYMCEDEALLINHDGAA
jgi:hypothetical protein